MNFLKKLLKKKEKVSEFYLPKVYLSNEILIVYEINYNFKKSIY